MEYLSCFGHIADVHGAPNAVNAAIVKNNKKNNFTINLAKNKKEWWINDNFTVFMYLKYNSFTLEIIITNFGIYPRRDFLNNFIIRFLFIYYSYPFFGDYTYDNAIR